MYGTHALYARSVIYEGEEWELMTTGNGEPILAFVTTEADGAVTFMLPVKLHCGFHDELEYQWRPATQDIYRLAEEIAAKLKAEFAEVESSYYGSDCR